jgi:hypothetical protein
VLATAGAATDPGARCAGVKMKAAARKSSAKLKCHARATARGLPVDQACLDKAEAKFSSSWQRIEATASCRTTDDEANIENQVDAFVSNVARQLAPCGRGIGGVCGGTCPSGLNCFEIGVGCFGEAEPCRCYGSTTTCPSTTSTSTTIPGACGTVGGVCGGTCPFGGACFEIGVGCFGEPEPCRCHGTTTTCPPSTTTTSTLP